MKMPRTLAILGAGCAGTLLARNLRRRCFPGHIALLDLRTDFSGEQRWCFWRDRQTPLPDVPINREWTRWQVRDHRQQVTRCSPRYAYSHVHAPEFFGKFHARLADDPAVSLALGCQVEAVSSRPGGKFCVATSRGELVVDEVIDARHAGADAYQETLAGAILLLWQSFLGEVIECAEPCFDPVSVTLMDFRVPFAGGLAFGYVLPFSSTRALVEVAVISTKRPTNLDLAKSLAGYLTRQVKPPSWTLGTERGELPMTPATFASRHSSGIIAIGIGGGAARPSSGYALGRILRSIPRLTDAILKGQKPGPLPLAPKYRVLDALFLRLLRDDPAAAKRAFLAMFAKVPPDRLVRFLSELSSLRDDIQLGWALPKRAFFNVWLARSKRSSTLPINQSSLAQTP